MSKNKLMWNIALFLIVLISLPIAYAQAFTGSRIFFILVNATIIGIVLFILQAFLMPGKDPKEKTSVWFIVVAASLLIAWLFGQTGFIWQTGPLAMFFSIYVLVNSVIIAAVLYFLLGLLKVNEKLGSKEGQAGYGILIFLVSLVFAVKLGNQWVWSQPSISTLISFLFGNEGILTPNKNRIFIFITTSVLLAWFFNFLGVGKENTKINYALAIILAANLVSGPDPLTFAGVKILVLVVGTIIIGRNLAEQFPAGKWKIGGYAIAFFLMWWAISAVETAVTPEGKAAVEKGGGGVTGWISGFFSILLSSKALWILGAIILFLFFVIFRGETRRRVLTLGWSELKRRLNATTKSTEFTEDVAEGRESSFFVRYRMLFHALANYTTRSEITYRYWSVIKQAYKMWEQLENRIKEFLDQEKLRKDIIAFRQGGTLSNGEKIEGWNRLNLEVVDLINRYYALLARIQISSQYTLKKPTEYSLETGELAQIQETAVRLSEQIKNIHDLYQKRLNAYGAHYALKGYRDITVNMCNVTGDVLEHPQKFARPGAEFDMSNQVGKPDTARADAEGYPIDEVNQYGEVIADINEQKDSFGNLPPDPRDYKRPRKVHPKDIIDYPNFVKFLDNISKDWRNLAYDIRYGLFHPFSRTHSVYIKAFGDRIYPEFQDKDIPFENSPSTSDWAVDMRALANPSLNKYWGRTGFHDDFPPSDNPLPILSALGLKKFLFEAAKLAHTDQEVVREYLNKYFADSAAPEKDWPKWPIGVMFGEEVDLSKEK